MNNRNAQFRGMTPMPVLLTRTTPNNDTVQVYGSFSSDDATYATVNVTATPVLLMAANPNRAGFILKNQGVPNIVNDEIFWGLNASLVAPGVSEGPNRGQLLCFGETFSSVDMPNYQGAVYAVCGSGESSQVSVVEWSNA